MDIKLISATKKDYEFARRAHHHSYKDMVIRQFGSWDDKLQDDFFDRTWNRLPHTIIEVNNERCGYCCIQNEANILWVRELVICLDHQNRGIGSSLLEQFIHRGKLEEIHVQLNVMKTNSGAKRLYERLGFKIYGDNDTHYFMRID